MAKPVRCRDKWRIRWIDADGRRHSAVYASYREAEYELRRRQAEVEEVRRGLRRVAPTEYKFGDLCDYWVAHRAPRKRSGKDDESIIRAHLRPLFATVRLADINAVHVDRFVESRAHLDSKTVANVLTVLITMLNVAKNELRWITEVPRIRKPRVRVNRSDYRWLRTTEEIARFLRAAREDGEHVFALYATAVYTGMRAGELAALQWSDVSFERRLITVQRSFDGPTKADDVRYVPLLDALLPVLRAWRLRHPGALVFTNEAGRMLRESSRIFQEVLHRVLRAAEFPCAERRGKTRSYIVFHDLRHTFASHWVLNGGDLFKLQSILGHKSTAMTLRYAHLAPGAFAGDYGRLGAAVTTEPAPVAALTNTP